MCANYKPTPLATKPDRLEGWAKKLEIESIQMQTDRESKNAEHSTEHKLYF